MLSQCGVQIPMGTTDLSLLQNIHTNSGSHPASYSMGTGAPSPSSKAVGALRLATHLHLLPRLRFYNTKFWCSVMEEIYFWQWEMISFTAVRNIWHLHHQKVGTHIGTCEVHIQAKNSKNCYTWQLKTITALMPISRRCINSNLATSVSVLKNSF
jgi:hypothetical protein